MRQWRSEPDSHRALLVFIRYFIGRTLGLCMGRRLSDEWPVLSGYDWSLLDDTLMRVRAYSRLRGLHPTYARLCSLRRPNPDVSRSGSSRPILVVLYAVSGYPRSGIVLERVVNSLLLTTCNRFSSPLPIGEQEIVYCRIQWLCNLPREHFIYYSPYSKLFLTC